MNKKALILDLDGTLYFQFGVQCIMGCWMLLYHLFFFWKFKDFLAIMYYRKLREKDIKDVVDNQYILVAEKFKTNSKHIEEIVQTWLFNKPLKVLSIFKDKKLSKIIAKCKENGLKIIIYSDYPTKEKLSALNILYDETYDSTCPEIRTLKPDSKGLQYILKSNSLNKDDVLYVGDRDSKDGECARRCNVDYIILPKFSRQKKYIEILQKVGI